MALTGAKILSAAPSPSGLLVETGPSPFSEVFVGSEIVEFPPEPIPVPVLSAPDVVGVLLEPPPGMPLLNSVLSLSSALLVGVLPLPLVLSPVLSLVLVLSLPLRVAVSLSVPLPLPESDPGRIPPFSQVFIIVFNSSPAATSGQKSLRHFFIERTV